MCPFVFQEGSMLQSIRDRSQGWLTWFLVITICITFALWGIHSYFESSGTNQTVASVNGEVISKQQWQLAYEHLREQAAQTNVESQDMTTFLKQQALETLIKNKVLSQAALQAGYRVTQAQLNAVLSQIPVFNVDGQFSAERFNEAVARMGYTPNGFMQALKAELLQNQLQSGFIIGAFALPNEVQQIQTLLNQRRDISYVIIPSAQFKNQTITSNQVAEYYAQHQEKEFMLPEQVSIEYLELDLDKLSSEQMVTEAELKQYYQDNLAHMTQPARYHLAHIFLKLPNDASSQQSQQTQAKLTKLAAELKTAERFSELAKTYSDDLMSAKQGGDLGWSKLSDLEPSISSVVSKLTKAGEITAPIRTQAGYEILKLVAVEPAKVLPYEQAKNELKHRLAQQKAQQVFTDLSDKLADLSYSNPNSLEIAAKALNLNVQQTGLFSRQGGDTSLTRNTKILASAFNKDVLDGNNSDVIELTPGKVVVLRIKQHQAAIPMPLAQVKSMIEAKLEKQAIQSQAKQMAEQVVASIDASQSLDQLAKKYGLKWNNLNALSRHSEIPDSAIVKTAFGMTLPVDKNKTPAQLVKLPAGDYAVVVLRGAANLPPAKLSAQANEAFANELALSYAQTAYELYVDRMMRQAKVERSEANT